MRLLRRFAPRNEFLDWMLLTSFLALAPASFAASSQTSLQDPAQIAVFNQVSGRLICQCGCQMMLSVCHHENCPSAVPLRKFIDKRILEGVQADAIVEELVREHGLKILSSPPAKGFNILAWITPAFLTLAGLFAVAGILKHLLRRKNAQSGPARSVEPELNDKIEEELRQIE